MIWFYVSTRKPSCYNQKQTCNSMETVLWSLISTITGSQKLLEGGTLYHHPPWYKQYWKFFGCKKPHNRFLQSNQNTFEPTQQLTLKICFQSAPLSNQTNQLWKSENFLLDIAAIFEFFGKVWSIIKRAKCDISFTPIIIVWLSLPIVRQ